MNLFTVQDSTDPNVVAVVVAEDEVDAMSVVKEAKLPPSVKVPIVERLDLKLLKRVGRQVLWARWIP